MMTMKNKLVTCACGCGTRFQWLDAWGRPRRYVSGHNTVEPIERRFWRFVRKSENCWEWTGSRFPERNGWGNYGRVSYQGSPRLAHRVSWEMHFGPIPDGLIVRHKCDNPACVRPDHLELGTPHDNNLDMATRGRSTAGTKNRHAKLTEYDVTIIRSLLAAGVKPPRIAKRFNVTSKTIRRILRGETWTHVP